MILNDAQIRDGLRIYAIGDVHGCIIELRQMIANIDAEQTIFPSKNNKIIFLGDYVDRGPANREVVDYLIELKASDRDIVFLKGNHDQKVLLFLKNPKQTGKDFLKWGGDATLRDYGVNINDYENIKDAAYAFSQSLPHSHKEFFKGLEYSYSIDDYFFCHAGVRPGVLLSKQSKHDLCWIRTEFLFHEEPFEKVIIHGHTITDEPEVKQNRINVDTCCYDSGRLTAVVLDGKKHRFLQT